MRKIFILSTLLYIFSASAPAQSLEQGTIYYSKGEYEKALPIFKRYVRNNPNNGNYNHWYGVSCYKTGNFKEAEKHLLKAAKRKVTEAFRYLGEYYFETYRFEEAADNYESYISLLAKKRQSTEAYAKLVEKARLAARMLKGVEEVTFIDSFVVDKKDFLQAYKLSEESGYIATYDEYFGKRGENPGTVYRTQLGNKLIFGNLQNKKVQLFSQTQMLGEWTNPVRLPEINRPTENVNYPYMLSDGVTLYYASDGEGSIGGYDIFVTRYNSETNSYLNPENVGMPFNSPFNDYMYAIDEYNNLGWFASDRYQPDGKVCVYVFIPNSSKQVYNYEGSDIEAIRKAAMIQSIRSTWKDRNEVKAAKQRLTVEMYNKPKKKPNYDFTFVINDQTVYHFLNDFVSNHSKTLFKQWQQKKKDYVTLSRSLENKRQAYAQSKAPQKKNMAPEILDLEKRVEQMEQELKELEINVRNEENKQLSQ